MKNYDESFFNWTMTYRLSADVVWNYGYRGDLISHMPLGKEAVDKIIASKKNTAVSNLRCKGGFIETCRYNKLSLSDGKFILMIFSLLCPQKLKLLLNKPFNAGPTLS